MIYNTYNHELEASERDRPKNYTVFVKCKKCLNEFIYYKITKHLYFWDTSSGDAISKLTCEELIIKNIIE